MSAAQASVTEIAGRSAASASPGAVATITTPRGTAAAVLQRATATAVQREAAATVSMLAVQGMAGGRGEQGERGERGPSGNVTQAFLHRQIEPALLWIVNHNLGLQPAITTIASLGGAQIIADVLHVSDNQLRVSFVEPTAGLLRCI